MRLLTIGFLALALPAAAAVPVTTQDLLLRVGRSTERFWKKLQAVT
jgi:hypothetical protein